MCMCCCIVEALTALRSQLFQTENGQRYNDLLLNSVLYLTAALQADDRSECKDDVPSKSQCLTVQLERKNFKRLLVIFKPV